MVEKIATDEGFLEEIQKIVPKEQVFVKQEALKELTDTYSEICANSTKDDIRKYLTNYFIIRLVGWIENYFKNSVIWLIDYYNLSYDEFKLELKLPDLKKIQQAQDFTAGKIVSRKLNFQNLGEIFGAMNAILGIHDFAQRLEQEKVTIGEIQDILEIRHKVIHNFESSNWDHNRCLQSKQAVMKFIFSSNIVVINRLKELGKY